MRKLVWVCGLFLSLAVPAMAQDETPRFEAAGGYSYVRANVTATPAGGTSQSQGFNANGGSGSVAVNLNRWFGAVADLGGYTGNQNITINGTPTNLSGNVFSYLFGPRISARHSRWTPFAQALFGGAHGSGTAKQGTASASKSKNVFAFTIGGGLDASVSKHFAIRLIQAEYFYTNFTSPASSGLTIPHQNNARLTFGVVVH